MTIDALIEALSADVRPVPPGAAQRRLTLAVGAGALAALVLMLGFLGVRPDLAEAASGGPFWAKAGYTLFLGTVGLFLAGQLARPESMAPGWQRCRFRCSHWPP